MRRYFFFTDKTRRKRWLHAIRRDEGKDFRVTKKNKVRSLHFRPNDLRNSFNGRVYLNGNAMKSWISTNTYCCSDSFKESETLQGTNANELRKNAFV